MGNPASLITIAGSTIGGDIRASIHLHSSGIASSNERSPDFQTYHETIVRVYHHMLISRSNDHLDMAAAEAQSLLLRLTEKENISDIGAGRTADKAVVETLDHLVGTLVEQDRAFTDLLQLRARLRDQLGRWPEALHDLQSVVSASDIPSAQILFEAGTLLMTLGNYGQSRQLLRAARRLGLDLSEHFAARQLESWIDDYQGFRLRAVRNLQLLRIEAVDQGAPREILGGIDHRIGRALYSHAVSQQGRNATALTLALSYLKEARRLTPEANPFTNLWLSRVHDALGSTTRQHVWDEACERFQVLGESGVGHVHLVGGRRAIAAGQTRLGRHELWLSLEAWQRRGYPKGVFDAAYALGCLYAATAVSPKDRYIGLRLLRISERIAARQQLAERAGAERALQGLVDRIDEGDSSALLHRVDDDLAESPVSELLNGYSIRYPDRDTHKTLDSKLQA